MTSKTRSRLEWILGVVLLAAPLASAQQQPPARHDEDEQARQKKEPNPVFVFRISPQLLSDGLDLLVEKRLAKDYGFDEYQHEQMRQLLHEHVPMLLAKHREELQDLWAEWIEAQARRQPPDPEDAAKWAERLLPIVEEARGTLERVSENMREFLDDEQEVLLDGYVAAINIGTTAVANRLREFKDGGFDPEIHWPGYKHVRHMSPAETRKLQEEMETSRRAAMDQSRRARGRRARQSVESGAAALVAEVETAKAAPVDKNSKDEWTRYVEAFIRRYRLNDEQKQKADTFLQQQVDQRDRYLLGKGAGMKRVEKMFANAKTDERLALAESAYQKLNEPLERMFEQLKRKLDTLPTRAQRRAAALSEKKERDKRRLAPRRAADERRP